MESRLQQRRKELGLTLEEVGNIVGVSKSTVKKWESGSIENMKRDKIALLAKALRVSPLYIMDPTCDFAIFNGNETIDMILYKNIKKKRLELGMSQEQLAKKVGYSSRSMIAKIEAGDIDLHQSKIEEIAIALGTTSAELMGWLDESPIAITSRVRNNGADGYVSIADVMLMMMGKKKIPSEVFEAWKRANGYDITDSSQKHLLAYAEKLYLLNKVGQEEALKRIEELTYIDRYTKKENEKTHLLPQAAHNDDADDPEQQRLMQEDLDELE